MKLIKSIACAALALTVVFSLASCSAKDPVIAVVNSDKVYYSDYDNLLQNTLQSYGIAADKLNSYLDADQLLQFKQSLLNELVDQKLILQQGKTLGFTNLSDSDQATINQQVDDYMDYLKSSIRQEVLTDIQNGELFNADNETENRFNKYMEESGYSRDTIFNLYLENFISTKVQDYYTADVTVTDADIRGFYDDNLKAQQDLAASDPTTALDAFKNGQNSVNLYVPVGADRKLWVKHVLVALPQDIQDQVSSLRTDGKNTEAQQLYDAEMAKILPTAQEVLAKAKNGDDFDQLIAQYGGDPGMTSDPYKTEGYEISTGSGMAQAFEDASLALQNVNDISDLVATDYGYHIIKCVKIQASGAIPFEEVKDDIQSYMADSMRSVRWNGLLDQWTQDAQITTYADRLK